MRIKEKLGNICEFVGGGTPSKKNSSYWSGSIPWASIKDIKGEFLYNTIDSISEEGLKNSAASLVYEGELVLATRINPGKIITSKLKAAINQDLKIVRPKKIVDANFLKYSIRAIEASIVAASSGTTVKGITLNNLREIQIYFPEIDIQKAIVSKIEELFSELDKGIENLKAAQEQLKTYRQSVLKWAFEGRLTNENVKEGELPKSWEVKKLSDVTSNFDGKRIPLSREVRSKRKGEYRYYGATEIVDHIDGFIFDGTYLLIGEDGANLLSKSKPLCQIVSGKFWVNNHAHVLQPKETLSIDFLNYYFNSLNIAGYVTGTAQPKLSQGNMNKIPVPLPSADEQLMIVKELDCRLTVADKMDESINESLVQAEALRQSILKKAFEGKL